MKICFATHNENKLQEIQQILPYDFQLIGLDQLGLTDEIPETGDTLAENSMQKASFVFRKFQIPVFADDTGLEVIALQNAPGVYSARYAGKPRIAKDNMNLVLANLIHEKNRNACFKTIITFISEVGGHVQFEGRVDGQIVKNPKGKKGFGYDPIFQPIGYEKTFAEMTAMEKNEISHRARAFKKFIDYLAAP